MSAARPPPRPSPTFSTSQAASDLVGLKVRITKFRR